MDCHRLEVAVDGSYVFKDCKRLYHMTVYLHLTRIASVICRHQIRLFSIYSIWFAAFKYLTVIAMLVKRAIDSNYLLQYKRASESQIP